MNKTEWWYNLLFKSKVWSVLISNQISKYHWWYSQQWNQNWVFMNVVPIKLLLKNLSTKRCILSTGFITHMMKLICQHRKQCVTFFGMSSVVIIMKRYLIFFWLNSCSFSKTFLTIKKEQIFGIHVKKIYIFSNLS